MTWEEWKRWLTSDSMSMDRLKSAIHELEVRHGNSTEPWAVRMKEHLKAAQETLKQFNVNSGFEALHRARREAIEGWTDEERAAYVLGLRQEVVSKLSTSWRGTASVEMLESAAPASVPIAAVRQAMEHRDTYGQNIYRKILMQRSQLLWLAGVLVFLLGCLCFLAASDALKAIDPEAGSLLPLSMFLGLLGGSLSAAISVTSSTSDVRIPAAQRSRMILLTRGLVGASAAVPVYVLVRGGMIVMPQASTGEWGLLLFAFLAGFSERWFLSTITSTQGE